MRKPNTSISNQNETNLNQVFTSIAQPSHKYPKNKSSHIIQLKKAVSRYGLWADNTVRG